MSNNLNTPTMSASQAQKEVTFNDVKGKLDAAITESYTASVAAGNATLTDAQFREAVRFLVSGAATTGRQLIVPQIKHLFLVTADAGNSDPITVKRGTTEFEMQADSTSIFYTDGTANGLVQVAGGGGLSGVSISSCFVGQPGAGDTLILYVATDDFSLPAGLTGSQGASLVAADATADFDIQKNGVSCGTMSFAGAATTATFTMASQTDFTAGDILSVYAPNPQDATLEDITFTLKGTV